MGVLRTYMLHYLKEIESDNTWRLGAEKLQEGSSHLFTLIDVVFFLCSLTKIIIHSLVESILILILFL